MSERGSRGEVLERVRGIVGNRYEDRRVPDRSVFCPECGDDITPGNGCPGQPIRCPDPRCGYRGDRALIFDDRALWRFNGGEFEEVPRGELVHFSVGVRIRRDGKLLLFRRTLFPVGQYTIPAGHLEAGEDPGRAAIREAYEETGLALLSRAPEVEGKPLFDPCRRGADYHVWYLYAAEAIGDPRLSYEADIMGWYDPESLRSLPLTVATRAFLGDSPSERGR